MNMDHRTKDSQTPTLFEMQEPRELRSIPVGNIRQPVYLAGADEPEAVLDLAGRDERAGAAKRKASSARNPTPAAATPPAAKRRPGKDPSPRRAERATVKREPEQVSASRRAPSPAPKEEALRAPAPGAEPSPVPETPGESPGGQSARTSGGGRDGQPAPRTRAVTAEMLATQQREISVSEFFAKNRHLLGFDNKRKALLTTVKEAVDNSLDACEEAHVLPEIHIVIDQLAEERFRVLVRDNGPGIVKSQVPNIFGKLLYGSKFHRLKMSRGQQGIGISAAGMYGVLTTGKSMRITSRTDPHKEAHYFEIQIDTAKNKPDIIKDEPVNVEWDRGTEVSIELVASYAKGRQSVDEYIEQTAIANPHAAVIYRAPTGEHREFPRGTQELPAETREIQPHPHGIELGVLMKLLKDARPHKKGERSIRLVSFLQHEFCRVSARTANEICEAAKLDPSAKAHEIGTHDVEQLYQAMQNTKIMAPPTDCLAPIGVRNLLAGLLKEVKAEFYTATTRDPAVYRGNPFQIEIGLAYGGNLPADQVARVIRFANRVPLMYQQSACAAYKSVLDVDWRNYGLSQPSGSLPVGPLVVMVHMASVWVPFTSESKEAIADYDEIRKEMKLALQECGRKLATYLRRRKRQRLESERRNIFERYIPDVAESLAGLTGVAEARVLKDLQAIARTRTAEADVELDENGKPVERGGDDAENGLEDGSTVIVPENEATEGGGELFE